MTQMPMTVHYIGADGSEQTIEGLAWRSHVTERGERSALTLMEATPTATVHIPWDRIVLVIEGRHRG